MRALPPAPRAKTLLRGLLVAALGVGLALLVGCGNSARGLIPSGQAGPLLGDFQAVQHAAEQGHGDCTDTEKAIEKTERDYQALPASLDTDLRTTLRHGIENLGARAHELCSQPPSGATTSTTTTPAPSTPAPKAKTTPTQTTTTPPAKEETEPEKPSVGGAPGEETKENPGGVEPGESAPKPGEEAPGAKQEGSG